MVCLVEVEYQKCLVGYHEGAEGLIDFVDSGVAGCPEGRGEVVGQLLVEKQAGTLVGKHHRMFLDGCLGLTLDSVDQMLCYSIEKGIHHTHLYWFYLIVFYIP